MTPLQPDPADKPNGSDRPDRLRDQPPAFAGGVGRESNASEMFENAALGQGPDRGAAESEESGDAMLDILIAEAMGQSRPADFTHTILSRLKAESTNGNMTPSITATVEVSAKRKSRERASEKGGAFGGRSHWSVLASIAALMLVAVGIAVGNRYRASFAVKTTDKTVRPQSPVGSMEKNVASSNSAGLTGSDIAKTQPRPSQPTSESQTEGSGAPAPIRSIELAGSPNPSDPAEMIPNAFQPNGPRSESRPADSKSLDPKTSQPPRPMTLVSASIQAQLTDYWQRARINPTPKISDSAIVDRIRRRLGVSVSPDAISDPVKMRAALNTEQNRKVISSAVLASVLSRPAGSLSGEFDLAATEQVNRVLQKGSGFDRLFASWCVPNSPPVSDPASSQASSSDSASATPLQSLMRPLSEHERIVAAASLAKAMDLRCQRCHDISGGSEGLSKQHDYWQWTASVSPVLGLRSDPPGGRFYDTPEGIRRIARPDSEPLAPESLIGSTELAEGLVQSMWMMVHGRPMRSSVFDLSGGIDYGLISLRAELASDLVSSQFDLLRTLSLLLTDPAFSRSTPEALEPQGVLTATDQQWREAVSAVESFAAAPPASLPSSQSQRLRLVQQIAIPSIERPSGFESILAQPISRDETQSDRSVSAKPAKPPAAVLAGLPMRQTVVMPAWLSRLPDLQSRLHHLAHLAGQTKIDESLERLALDMAAANIDEALILERIWWIIRPLG